MSRSPAHSYLLPVSLAGFCLGLSVARYFSLAADKFLLLPFFLLAALLCWLSLRTAQLRDGRLLLAIGLLFFMAGTLRLPARDLSAPANNAYYLFAKPEKISFVAEVTGLPVVKNDILQFDARLVDLFTPEKWSHTSGRIRLSMPADAGEIRLSPGRMVLGRGKISRIDAPRNPGAFDYRQFMAESGIFLKGWIDSPANLQNIEAHPSGGFVHNLKLLPKKIRHHIHLFLNQSLPPLQAALYGAILIGDRSSVPVGIVENFKAAGAMHLLAISGLHVGMLALFCLLFFSFLLRRFPAVLHSYSMWKIASALTLLPLTAYALIAGFQPPVVRSLLMFTVLTVAVLANRRPNLPNSIILAALLILALTPEALVSVSFQLTFTAVFAIVLFSQYIYPGQKDHPAAGVEPEKIPFSRRVARIILLSLACSVAASIGTAPLILHHFNRISLISPLSSLIIGPLFCFIALPLGFCACLLLPVSHPLAHLLLQLGGKSLLLSAGLCAEFSRLPFADLYLPPPSWLEVFLCYGFFLALLFRKKGPIYKKAALLLAVFLACTTFLQHVISTSTDKARIVYLDVGQGNATVLHLPGNKTFVIDGGKRQRNGIDVGSDIIAPYLLRNNILRLEGIILTHPHADHYNGLFFLLEKFRPKTLWINTDMPPNGEYADLLRTARLSDTEIRIPGPVEVLQTTGEYRLSALNAHALLNDAGDEAPHRAGINDGLVVKLSNEKNSLLFPGDIGRETEEYLAAAMPSFLKADILLASHHGSRGSNSTAFLAAVAPSCLVISTSRREHFLARTTQNGKDPKNLPVILTTARQGAVTAIVADESITVSTEGKTGLTRATWHLRPSPAFSVSAAAPSAGN